MSSNYSSVSDDGLSPDDPLFWSLPTPINCTTVQIIGVFLCVAGFTGILLNGSLLISFATHKALRTPSNIFIIFIAGVGLFACCATLPLTGSSAIFCHWLYNRVGCQIEGLFAFLYGCSSCYLLCTVSLSRCYIIIRPFHAKDVTVSCTFFRRKKRNMNNLGYEMHYNLMRGCINCISLDYITTCWME